MKTEFKNQIEEIIDKTSVAALLQAIAEICYLKASHLDENWQDKNSKIWMDVGKKIENLSEKISV